MCGYVRVCVRGFNSHAFIRKKAYDESSITSSTQFVAHQLSRVNYVKLSYICVVSIFIDCACFPMYDALARNDKVLLN